MSENTMKDITRRIKSRRLELGYSFQDLAKLTGMNKSTLQRYEAGSIKNIPLDKLKILSQSLNVEPEWIMGWDDVSSSSAQEHSDEDLIINAYRNADSLTRDMVKRCLGISTIDDTDETVNKIVRKVSRKKDSGIPNSAIK